MAATVNIGITTQDQTQTEVITVTTIKFDHTQSSAKETAQMIVLGTIHIIPIDMIQTVCVE